MHKALPHSVPPQLPTAVPPRFATPSSPPTSTTSIRRKFPRVLPLFAAFALLVAGIALARWHTHRQAASASDAAPFTRDDLFSGPIQRIEVNIGPAQLQSLQRNPRNWVRATVRVHGREYPEVALHLKGQGTFRSVIGFPSLTVDFDKFRAGQEFAGLDRLHLNNGAQDESRLCEVLASELCLAAGVPAARATPVLVTLNGRDLGPYVLKEAIDKKFLKRHFGHSQGTLYEPSWGADINALLATQPDIGPSRSTEIRSLLTSLPSRSVPKSLEYFEQHFDVDRLEALSALQCLWDDWDGYFHRSNNYRLYYDPPTGKFTILPYGMDMIFQRPEARVLPRIEGLAGRALLARSNGVATLGNRILHFANTLASSNRIESILVNHSNRLAAALSTYSPEAVAPLNRGINELRQRALERLAFVHNPVLHPVEFDSNQVARLPHWTPRTGIFTAQPQHEEIRKPDGTHHLVVRAYSHGSLTQWRTLLTLPPGHFQVTGRAKSDRLEAYPGNRSRGLALRTMLDSSQFSFQDTTPWTEFSYEFVLNSTNQVDLSFDLRANSGEATIDVQSLRIRRRDFSR